VSGPAGTTTAPAAGSLAELVGQRSGPVELDVVRAARRRGRPRVLAVTTGLSLALLGVVCFSVTVGSFPIPVLDVPGILLGFGDSDTTFIVNELRLPRIVCGILVGLAFGVSGAIFQSLVQNELASPDIIGITAGASTAAVLMIVVVGASATQLSLAALVGAGATALAIYLLAYRTGVTGYRLILVGIGFAAGLGAVTSYLVLRAELDELQRANVWLIGSLNGRGWEQVGPLAVVVAVLVPAAVLLRHALRGLQLGDDTAIGIGVRVNQAKVAILLVGVALAAFATAAAGPVAFVAFVSAPIARRLLGNGDVALLTAGLFGALLLTSADVVARLGIGGFELPVGILTGILGAPYLVWLLIQTNRSSTGD
jgi:iron complex transport system permease protein